MGCGCRRGRTEAVGVAGIPGVPTDDAGVGTCHTVSGGHGPGSPMGVTGAVAGVTVGRVHVTFGEGEVVVGVNVEAGAWDVAALSGNG